MSLPLPPTPPPLLARLYLEAVLPVLPELAARDATLAALLAGPPVGVTLCAPGGLRARVLVREGQINVIDDAARSTRSTQGAGAGSMQGVWSTQGDLVLGFPSARQLTQTLSGRGRGIALPLWGWWRLPRAARLLPVSKRLTALLEHPPAACLALSAWARLWIGLRATTVWLRHHAHGPETQAALGAGVVVFTGQALVSPLWLDLSTLNSGTGPAPSPTAVTVEFNDLDTLLAELAHTLDAPAALGLGTLRITGLLPLAERLGLFLLEVGNLLQPRVH